MDAYLTSETILMLAAVVTSYVGVAKGYGLNKKHTHLFALVIAAIFLLVPTGIQQILVTISIVGLTASGAYNYSKNKAPTDKKQK